MPRLSPLTPVSMRRDPRQLKPSRPPGNPGEDECGGRRPGRPAHHPVPGRERPGHPGSPLRARGRTRCREGDGSMEIRHHEERGIRSSGNDGQRYEPQPFSSGRTIPELTRRAASYRTVSVRWSRPEGAREVVLRAKPDDSVRRPAAGAEATVETVGWRPGQHLETFRPALEQLTVRPVFGPLMPGFRARVNGSGPSGVEAMNFRIRDWSVTSIRSCGVHNKKDPGPMMRPGVFTVLVQRLAGVDIGDQDFQGTRTCRPVKPATVSSVAGKSRHADERVSRP